MSEKTIAVEVQDITEAADAYMDNVYPQGVHARQRDEIKQAFVAGMHVGAQLRNAPQEVWEAATAQIEEFHRKRIQDLFDQQALSGGVHIMPGKGPRAH